jgi:hypothetical protein
MLVTNKNNATLECDEQFAKYTAGQQLPSDLYSVFSHPVILCRTSPSYTQSCQQVQITQSKYQKDWAWSQTLLILQAIFIFTSFFSLPICAPYSSYWQHPTQQQ